MTIPAAVPMPGPSTCSPFDVPCKKEYQRREGTARAQLTAAQAVARRQAAWLMALPLPQSPAKRDENGCLFKARDLYPSAGQRYLVLVSDLGIAPQDPTRTTLRLPGVHVAVLFACTADSKRCLQRRAAWLRAFSRLGASSVRVLSLDVGPALFGHE